MDVLISNDPDAPWGYVRIFPQEADKFKNRILDAAKRVPAGGFIPGCFIHETCIYKYSKGQKEPEQKKFFTPIGLVFLQGDLEKTRDFLAKYMREKEYYLVKDKATGRIAKISNSQMTPFRNAINVNPKMITYFDNPISHFKEYARIRILSGILAGQTGYYVRYKRDRKLVMDMAGMTIAYGNIHQEEFEFI